MTQDDSLGRRLPWREGGGPAAAAEGWLALSDDELLYQIEGSEPGPETDLRLIDVVGSDRHFFIRQEAAKRIHDVSLLKDHSADRHIGQILARAMNRREDAEYLRKLAEQSRHLEVRKAAEAQLRRLESAVRDQE
jgi:hypothetical protein